MIITIYVYAKGKKKKKKKKFYFFLLKKKKKKKKKKTYNTFMDNGKPSIYSSWSFWL